MVYQSSNEEYYPLFLSHVASLQGKSDVLIFRCDYVSEFGGILQRETWDPIPYRNLFIIYFWGLAKSAKP